MINFVFAEDVHRTLRRYLEPTFDAYFCFRIYVGCVRNTRDIEYIFSMSSVCILVIVFSMSSVCLLVIAVYALFQSEMVKEKEVEELERKAAPKKKKGTDEEGKGKGKEKADEEEEGEEEEDADEEEKEEEGGDKEATEGEEDEWSEGDIVVLYSVPEDLVARDSWPRGFYKKVNGKTHLWAKEMPLLVGMLTTVGEDEEVVHGKKGQKALLKLKTSKATAGLKVSF